MLQITGGGTAAPTAAGARINLGLGPNSAVSFASLTLTGDLTVGGTASFGSASFTSFTVPDNGLSITGSSDATKVLKFEVDGFTTATTRTITIPNASTTMVGTNTTQTLTNKSIDAGQLTGTVVSARLSGSYTGITGTGALNAGSITSGFGSIDIGADSLTAGAGTLTTLTTSGAATIGGAFTSLGIDDNATAARLQLSNSGMTLGTTGSSFLINMPSNEVGLVITGGTAFNNGTSLILRGGTTGFGQDNDIFFYSDGTNVYQYDASAVTHTLTGAAIVTSTFVPLSLLDISGASAGQIKFPATQNPSANANTLDDYEEGSFTPTIEGTATVGVGTYTTQSGQYTKIGNVVYFTIVLNVTAHTGTGNMIVAGLPFTTTSTNQVVNAEHSNITLTAGNILTALTSTSATTILLRQTPTGGGAIANVPIDTSFILRLTGFYFV